MKLLEKKTLQTEINGQRKTQIDEGVKLAQKIDELRRLLATEEERHRSTLFQMKEERMRTITGLDEGISAKKKELVEIEKQREELIKPLDEKWEEVKLEEEKILTLKEEIRNLRLLASQNEKQTEDALKKVERKLQILTDKENETNKSLKEARELKENSARVYSLSFFRAEEKGKELDERDRKATRLQEENEVTRKANENIKGILLRKEKQLEDKERAINDKYETLQRTNERLKK